MNLSVTHRAALVLLGLCAIAIISPQARASGFGTWVWQCGTASGGGVSSTGCAWRWVPPADGVLGQGSPGSGPVGGGPTGGGSTNEPNNQTSTTKPSKDKNPPCTNRSGDPIEVSQGSRTETVTLFSTPGEMGLALQLFYVSPVGWSDTLSYWLHVRCGTLANPIPCTSIVFHRPDGSTITFDGTPGTVGSYPEVGGGGLATLTFSSSGTYTLHDENAEVLVFSSAGQLKSIVDSSGIGWSVTSDSNGRPIKVTHTSGRSFTLGYQVVYGFPTITTVTVTDPAGNVYQYTKQGMPNGAAFRGPFEVDSVTFPGLPTTTVAYKYATGNKDISDLIETDINGVPYSYGTYDSNYEATGTRLADGSDAFSIVYAFPSGGMTVTVTNPLGHSTVDNYKFIEGQYLLTSVNDEAVSDCGATTHTAAYDSSGNLTKTVDNDGVATTYSYAASGQLQTTTEAFGTALARKTDYAWDSSLHLNRLLSVTVEGETKVSYTYNAQNRSASITHVNLTAVGTANQSLKTTYAYTLYSDGMVKTMLVTQPSPNGTDHTTYAYDSYGNLTSVTDGLSHVTTYSNYNGLGEVGKVVGPNGDETDYTYDARGRVASKTTHPNGTTATWTYAYDGFGLLTKISAPDGEVVTVTRDAEKRVKTITHNDKDGTSTETFAYDANNDITSDVIARGSDVGKSTSYIYDALGRVHQVKGSHSQVLTYAYDGNGNVLSVTDALGHKTSFAYDALNRVIRTTNAGLGVTAYAYDAGDHVTRVTDPRGLVTSYTWDGLGQLWQQQSPDTGTTHYSHDAYGRLSSFIRADGTQTSLGHDALNRLVSKTAGGQSQNFTWDNCTNGKGRLCTAATASDSVDYSYTPEGWIAARAFSFAGGPVYDVGYDYNVLGQVAEIVYPDGNEALYDYSRGAVSDVRLKVGSSTVYGATGVTYRPMDLAMSSWTSSNGLNNTITYDSDLRPTKLIVPGVQAITYAYDAAGRLTGIDDGYNPPNLDETLTYDALSRLTTASSPSDNESYTYDADGNRTYQVINGVATRFAYAAGSNRLTSTSGGLSATYGYNADGNTTAVNGLVAYTYGPFGRLSNADGVAFNVSAEGQRLRKSMGGNITYFAPGATGALLAEDNNGAWNDYVRLNGRLVGMVRSGTIYAIHDDHLGRPEAVTLPNTVTVWRASDYPFTQRVTQDSLGGFNLGFPGQYYDSESGLWHNGYRDYDPATGRYIESDPIGLMGGINTYTYVGNNPISNVDPLGLCPSKKCQKALAAAGANAAALDRAMANMPALAVAASEFNIDPALLGAIGIRESGFRNVAQHGGLGRGVFQIDLGQNPTVTAGEAGNIWAASEYAAAELSANMATLGGEYPNFTPGQLLQATAASYNFGTGNISGNPSTIDAGTTGGNYGANVVNLMSCFPF